MAPASFGSSSNVIAEARRHLGGNPTGRGSLWCARFTNMVLQHSGYRGTGSDMDEKFESSSNNYNELNLNRPHTETDLGS